MRKKIYTGKRKTAVARAIIKEGKGKIKINNKPVEYFPKLQKLELREPLMIALDIIGEANFDIEINTTGGGLSSRIEAARLAVAKAIVGFTKNDKIKIAYLKYDRNMLVADTRRKETYKPGDSKARAKRQTSYR